MGLGILAAKVVTIGEGRAAQYTTVDVGTGRATFQGSYWEYLSRATLGPKVLRLLSPH